MVFLTWLRRHHGNWCYPIHTVSPHLAHPWARAPYTSASWIRAMPLPLCLCLVQFLQFAAKEHKKRLTKWCGWWQRGRYGDDGCHNRNRRRQWHCDHLRRGRWMESSCGGRCYDGKNDNQPCDNNDAATTTTMTTKTMRTLTMMMTMIPMMAATTTITNDGNKDYNNTGKTTTAMATV